MGWLVAMAMVAGVCWYGYRKGWFDGWMDGGDAA